MVIIITKSLFCVWVSSCQSHLVSETQLNGAAFVEINTPGVSYHTSYQHSTGSSSLYDRRHAQNPLEKRMT